MKSMYNRMLNKFPAYVPGEQPHEKGYLKLNTNENPYAPSPHVSAAVRNAQEQSFRLYSDPVCTLLRAKIGERYSVSPEQLFIGNGSDEVLRLAVLAFCNKGEEVIFPMPSYPLYETISAMAYAKPSPVSLDKHFTLPDSFAWEKTGCVKIIANPNSPTGTLFPLSQIEEIARNSKRMVIVDEAYADFAGKTSLSLLRRFDNILVCRTFSKSFALAGIRVGYAFGSPETIGKLFLLKDSYNVNALSQIAACAAMDDYEYMEKQQKKVIMGRELLASILRQMGFLVVPSHANFLFVKPSRVSAGELYRRLKERKILVRYFTAPATKEYVRITIGTPAELKTLVNAIREIA